MHREVLRVVGKEGQQVGVLEIESASVRGFCEAYVSHS